MSHTVDIDDLTKSYKKFRLDSISLKLPEGLILGLIGPNGAGKTTTLKILMDMIRADSGQVRIFGLDHRTHTREIKNRVGYVGEEPQFYGDKSVSWTGGWISRFYRNWDLNLFEKMLTDFGISRTKKTGQLSKGMRVKLSLALALSHRPELLILDEPTAGLDPVVRRDVLERLRHLSKDQGLSVLISSHITDDIARIADLIVFLIDGRVTLAESKDDLLAKWKRIHFQEEALEEGLASSLKCRKTQVFGSSGITDNYPSLKQRLVAGLDSQAIKVENLNLDDILIACVKGDRT
ncbi:MAG: ABC transporter ATP-binding protein [Candidatus Aminicenantaceae bacterium]